MEDEEAHSTAASHPAAHQKSAVAVSTLSGNPVASREAAACPPGMQYLIGTSMVVKVYTGTDVYIGEILHDYTCCFPRLYVKDPEGAILLSIHGPCRACCMCCNVKLVVKDFATGNEIGMIQKSMGDLVQEMFTNADTFGVSFPLNLDPRLKCLLIAATFLIDFVFFEEPKKGLLMNDK